MSHVLLIDDDQELCELLASWLRQEGFEVRACHDGQSARAELAQNAPAAVVLDVMLPDGSGLELLKQLRSEHPNLPVLMLSGRGEPLAARLVVGADGRRTLLTHHRKLDRWLQPGGHADGDADLARVALREAEEETGVAGLSLEDGAIFDLDRHWIPERGQVPGHWHYDVRYVVRAGADERFVVSEESHALAWREITVIAADPAGDASMRRMAGKWLARPV